MKVDSFFFGAYHILWKLWILRNDRTEPELESKLEFVSELKPERIRARFGSVRFTFVRSWRNFIISTVYTNVVSHRRDLNWRTICIELWGISVTKKEKLRTKTYTLHYIYIYTLIKNIYSIHTQTFITRHNKKYIRWLFNFTRKLKNFTRKKSTFNIPKDQLMNIEDY